MTSCKKGLYRFLTWWHCLSTFLVDSELILHNKSASQLGMLTLKKEHKSCIAQFYRLWAKLDGHFFTVLHPKKSDFFISPKNSTVSDLEELNQNRGGVYAEGHRQGVQVKGLLGRNPERARNGGAENECFEANSTGWFKSDPKIYLQQVDWPLCSVICFWRSWQYIYNDVSYLGLFFPEFKHELVVMTVGNSF